MAGGRRGIGSLKLGFGLITLLALFWSASALPKPEQGLLWKKGPVINFYVHDNLLIADPSAVAVVPPVTGITRLLQQRYFGSIIVFDDAITVNPDPSSTELARGRGIYVFDSMRDDAPAIQFVWTAVFNEASGYGGSTLSYQGHDEVLAPVREIPITGGTGHFRLARGFAVITTYEAKGAAFILNITSYLHLES